MLFLEKCKPPAKLFTAARSDKSHVCNCLLEIYFTWGRTGFSQVRRTPWDRAAMHGIAQDMRASALEGLS